VTALTALFAALGGAASLAWLAFRAIFLPELREEIKRRRAKAAAEKAQRRREELIAEERARDALLQAERRAAERALWERFERRKLEAAKRRTKEWSKIRPAPKDIDPNPYE